MNEPVALVTGAGGEMGRQLLPALHDLGVRVVALDLAPLDDSLQRLCVESVVGSILDPELDQLFRRHRPWQLFHLAAVLSAKAEENPDLAHTVNVEGTRKLFALCRELQSSGASAPVFMFPSSIAVYGLPDLRTKVRQGAVKENEWTVPSGIYGCNKLYCELIGACLSRSGTAAERPAIDFRAIRFPGLISADTLPTGGTTDYAPEMIHAAAQGRQYRCFVREDSRLPFMTMPDAVEALLRLARCERSSLTTHVYNIRAFSASAGEIRTKVLESFPSAKIEFQPIQAKQEIVDSWPVDVNDGLARSDWGFAPRHGLHMAVADYLVPALRKRYAAAPG